MDQSAIRDRRPALAIALVSFAGLLLELGLTRLFSVVLFYHFAFLAISVALLGLGAGGVFAYIRRPWLERWSDRRLGAWLCTANAFIIFVVLQAVLRISQIDAPTLTSVYLLTALPFFFVGLLFSVVFARVKEGIGRIYGADLLGGALACLAIVPLLNLIGGPNVVVFASVSMAVAAAIWAETIRARNIAVTIAAIFAILIAANYNGRLIDVVYAKGMLRDRSQSWVEFVKWNAISRVEVDKTGESRYIVIDADASTAIMNVDPAKWEQTQDPPTNLNLIDREKQDRSEGYNWKKDLMSAAPAIANVLRPNGKYAIIGPGGGVDVLRAVANGSKDVTGIEINPIIATDIMRETYADYAYHLYERPEVHLHVADGRSFIRNSKEKYDVIQMTLVDTWASTAAGAFALSENNLYTVEAFQEYFDHLKPDGFIAITRWEFKEPREALRVVSQAIQALQIQGPMDVRKHFVVISDGQLNVDGRPVVVIARKRPFTDQEAVAIRAHLLANPTLAALYLPDEEHTATAPPHKEPWRLIESATYSVPPSGDNAFHRLLSWGPWGRGAFCASYPYNISPVYDANPFFFFTLKTEDVIRKFVAGTGRGMDWRINLGVTMLFLVFVISIVAVISFLILPLLVFTKNSKPQNSTGGFTRLAYFIAIGLGFILVEIALIQRFVLFLGHPTYALTVVVFLMLLASGAGSLMAKRVLADSGSIWWPLVLIAAAVAAYLWLVPFVLDTFIGLPLLMKLAISALLIVPLGFLMGMPFPTGLRALAQANDHRAEWAWALNGAATVLGSVSAMIIAIHFGLNATLACGGIAYLFAAVFRVRIWPAS
jgi:hypothetical protein